MADATAAVSVSQQQAAVTVSQTDTGYQSNLMPTTGLSDGLLSITSVTAGAQYIHRQHLPADVVNSFDRTDDLR